MNEHDARNELAFIKQIMQDSARIIIDDGKIYLLWGAVIECGIVIEIVAVYFTAILCDSLYLWIGLISLGWICTLWLVWKKRSWPRAATSPSPSAARRTNMPTNPSSPSGTMNSSGVPSPRP